MHTYFTFTDAASQNMILSYVKPLISHNGGDNLNNLNEYLWKAALSDLF